MPDDREMLAEWQRTHDPKLFMELSARYQPVVNSVVNKFKTLGLPPATLRAHANAQMFKAFGTFDPSRGTQPMTHIWNSLQKVHRVAISTQMSGKIPEARNLKRAVFSTVKMNLTDQRGYEPSATEMADELGWSVKEVGRMNSELAGEVSASKAAFDFYGNSVTKEHKDKALVDYMYHELDGPEKVVFEHTFGYAGKPMLNNKEIAKVLGTNEMAVHRMKKKMSQKIQSYR